MARQSTELRRKQIAEAALHIISQQGLGRFTTAAIAAEIGLSEGALFRHFGSKKEIVDAAVERVEQLLAEAAPPHGDDPIQDLGVLFQRRVALMRRYPGVFRILFSDQLAQAASPDTVDRIEKLKQRSMAFIRECARRAVQRRLTRPGLEPPELFAIVHGTALSLAFSSAHPSTTDSPDPVKIWNTLEAMIRKR